MKRLGENFGPYFQKEKAAKKNTNTEKADLKDPVNPESSTKNPSSTGLLQGVEMHPVPLSEQEIIKKTIADANMRRFNNGPSLASDPNSPRPKIVSPSNQEATIASKVLGQHQASQLVRKLTSELAERQFSREQASEDLAQKMSLPDLTEKQIEDVLIIAEQDQEYREEGYSMSDENMMKSVHIYTLMANNNESIHSLEKWIETNSTSQNKRAQPLIGKLKKQIGSIEKNQERVFEAVSNLKNLKKGSAEQMFSDAEDELSNAAHELKKARGWIDS